MTFLGRADEEDAAIQRVLRLRDSLRRKLDAVDGFTGNRGIESHAKGILAEHTERCARGDLGGPFDELGKVGQVGGLHLILSRSR